jgi:hypothetical protein
LETKPEGTRVRNDYLSGRYNYAVDIPDAYAAFRERQNLAEEAELTTRPIKKTMIATHGACESASTFYNRPPGIKGGSHRELMRPKQLASMLLSCGYRG